jgi:deoxyribonuclease V
MWRHERCFLAEKRPVVGDMFEQLALVGRCAIMKWPIDMQAARQTQLQLRDQVRLEDDFGDIQWVAGADVGFEDQGKVARGAVAVLRYPKLELVETAVVRRPTEFPYIPGFLSFREIPVLRLALAQIKSRIDLIVCDGQGYAHPRRFGLACHLGLLLDVPTIGAAKSRLIGQFREPGKQRGCRCQLKDQDQLIGYVLRTRTNAKPLFVSPGHRVGFESAARITLSLCPKYRLPETTRQADRLTRG